MATRAKPQNDHLTEFAATHGGLVIEGQLTADALSSVSVYKKKLFRRGNLIQVFAPVRVHEPDDIDEHLAAAVPGAVWLIQIAVPAFANDGVEIATRLAQHIARKCQGAVFDPQVGRVTWPRAEKPIAKPSEERIREVELEWYFSPAKMNVDTGKLFLETVRGTCPEAAPTRFGSYEPLQGKLESGDDSPLLNAWLEASRDVLGTLFLKSRGPCFGGMVHLPGSATAREAGPRVASISLEFDGRVVFSDDRWRETVVSLFLALSRALHAFYARGFVLRDVILSRGGPAFDGRSENYPTGIWRGSWLGIPPAPSWLTWFGPPYSALTEESLNRNNTASYPEGIFLRMAEEPLDLDQLRGPFPKLPSQLLSGLRTRSITLPDGRQAKIEPAETTPATLIPSLE